MGHCFFFFFIFFFYFYYFFFLSLKEKKNHTKLVFLPMFLRQPPIFLCHNIFDLYISIFHTEDNYAIQDLMCWLDIESFRRMPHHDAEKRDNKAKDVKTKYLNKKYFFGPNSPASRKEQHSVSG